MSTHQKKHIKNQGTRELVYRNVAMKEFYAIINSNKGDARFEVTVVENNQTVMAKARGAIIKGPNKKRLEKGDMVLIQQDESNSSGDKYFVLHKYTPDDVKQLRRSGELAQVREVEADETTTVAFENEVVAAKKEEIVIDDDFIANL
jgi:initiation factor 1A